jgi:hypothetical protein
MHIPRDAYTIARLLLYGGGIALLLAMRQSTNPVVSGCVFGIWLADVVTWAGISLFELPSNIRQFTIDGLVNIASIVALFHFLGIEVPRDEERMFAAFLSFIGVAVAKAGFYLIDYFFWDEAE